MAFTHTAPHDYRIESRDSLTGSLLPTPNFNHLYKDASLAVAVAVKSVADPTRQDVRVVHIPSGEIVFRTTSTVKTTHRELTCACCLPTLRGAIC